MFNPFWQGLELCGFAGTSGFYLNSTVPVVAAGSLAIDPSLLMVLITKFFSRVKFVRPTLSELSITNTMSRAPQRFSQSERMDKNGVSMIKNTHTLKLCLFCDTRSPQQPHVSRIYVMTSQSCSDTYTRSCSVQPRHHNHWSILTSAFKRWLTVSPGSPTGPGSPWKHTRRTWKLDLKCTSVVRTFMSRGTAAYVRSWIPSRASPSWLTRITRFCLRKKKKKVFFFSYEVTLFFHVLIFLFQ